MSAIKANQISEALKEEELPPHQLMPSAMDAAEAPPLNLFSSSHTDIELSEFSEQNHQQSYEPFSPQAKKCSDNISSDRSSETISNAPIKWMSSKMRLMRKMMAQEQITVNKSREKIEALLHQEIKSSTGIKVCSFCSTTKTPLWRSGPQGPKSLCNACGIRQMKARRAATASGASAKQNRAMIIRNEKKFDVDRMTPYKKRYKFVDADHEKLKFDDSLTGSRENSSAIIHPTFPLDEKGAAFLLMTLSFG